LDFSGKNVLVAGMGRSGLAAVELLTAHGARVRSTDLKPLEQLPEAAPALERLGVHFELQTPETFQAAETIVLSPGVPADLEPLLKARARGVPVIGEVELAGYFLQGQSIGITGSNGKTTTTALTGHILRASGIPVQVGGNIGFPAAAMVASSRAAQWNVLELSSFQLETIERFRADIAVAINVTPDHLDRHHTFQSYAAAKARLFETQTPQDFAVLNADDATCAGYAQRTRARVMWFGGHHATAPELFLEGEALFLDGRPFLNVRDIPLLGRHNVENTMAAAAAAHLAGAPPDAIAAAVRTFPGVEHRLEFVRTIAGVDYYNDSKATNVDAALKAVDAFERGLWIILGGKDKGAPYTPLREPLAKKARVALLIGAAAAKIASELEGAVPLIHCGVLEQAVLTAHRQAAAGDTVLLAPACASFDQFENFEHRGRTFKNLVAQLEETQ
jgi:UDP-N-acetylmuramoylalanine--D-glutamate ligase